jgi:hypothetical protein
MPKPYRKFTIISFIYTDIYGLNLERRIFNKILYEVDSDSLCGVVVRVLGYRSGRPGSIPGTNIKK